METTSLMRTTVAMGTTTMAVATRTTIELDLIADLADDVSKDLSHEVLGFVNTSILVVPDPSRFGIDMVQKWLE
jgi:hypothetical protein